MSNENRYYHSSTRAIREPFQPLNDQKSYRQRTSRSSSPRFKNFFNAFDKTYKLLAEREYDEVIYMTPDAKTLTQPVSNALSLKKQILILTGHYKGVDQRIRDKYITTEISIGDYVLTGGELAAAVLCDSIIRLIPGVLGDETSALTDSFQDNLLSPPVYTRPAIFQGMKVPDILLSGNFPKIETWRSEKALERTQHLRPDLLDE